MGRGKAGDEMEGGGGAGFKMTDCSHKICFRFWVSCRAMQNTRKEKKKKKKNGIINEAHSCIAFILTFFSSY